MKLVEFQPNRACMWERFICSGKHYKSVLSTTSSVNIWPSLLLNQRVDFVEKKYLGKSILHILVTLNCFLCFYILPISSIHFELFSNIGHDPLTAAKVTFWINNAEWRWQKNPLVAKQKSEGTENERGVSKLYLRPERKDCWDKRGCRWKREMSEISWGGGHGDRGREGRVEWKMVPKLPASDDQSVHQRSLPGACWNSSAGRT